MKSLFKQRSKCLHKNYRNIYGDEIIFGTPDFCRSVCIDCGKSLMLENKTILYKSAHDWPDVMETLRYYGFGVIGLPGGLMIYGDNTVFASIGSTIAIDGGKVQVS